ncbi:MAG: hypothetical protein ACI4SF_13060 [Oscillospiraceae bacterium]
MSSLSKNISGYNGANPFGDYQARNFSDDKICSEFCPTSTFWSLFNAQHEILLGTRGSGKTFLLKMMRYSMLKNVDDEKAKKIISERRFFSLYVPMHLEFIASYVTTNLSDEQQIELFIIAFNCLLSQSLLYEMQEIIDCEYDDDQKYTINIELSNKINEMWFNDNQLQSHSLSELSRKVNKVFYTLDNTSVINDNIPIVFKNHICSPLLIVKDIIESVLGFTKPLWIICIDEAEFLNKTLLKCINSFFRSDTNGIAFKVATLPFYHNTLETLREGIFVSEGNDFNYRVIDMDYSSDDFERVTDRICYNRLHTEIKEMPLDGALESFLGKVGDDDYIDYYRLQNGKDESTYESIESKIISSFSDKKKSGSQRYVNKRKTIYDKYAPIFFIREMYKISQKGNSTPAWFCGVKTVRKVSQGNPRLFVHLMNDLFEKAKKNSLTPKAQHKVLCEFSNNICNSTLALESQGPIIYNSLCSIAELLHNKAHNGSLVTVSSSFILKYSSDDTFENNKKWIELAIAHSRIIVDENVKKGNLSAETKLCLAQVFSVKYWLPFRQDTPTPISISKVRKTNTYKVDTRVKRNSTSYSDDQLTFF